MCAILPEGYDTHDPANPRPVDENYFGDNLPAFAAVYLASPAGNYLSGKPLEVDGGITFPNLDLPVPDL